jgi:hypothetical protein
MSFKLPQKDFQWCDEEELKFIKDNISKFSINSNVGITLKVDLEYPNNLHDYHNDFPFFPEHKVIQKENLSLY